MINITNTKNIFYIFFSSLLIIAFISCSSAAPPAKKTQTPVKKETPAAKSETPKQNNTQNEKKEEKKPQASNDQNVSDAVYTQTFSDIEAFIAKLNKIISQSNFDEWKRYLTQGYIDYYSNPANLKTVSETPALKKHKIVLRSLKDYFTYVVVPSRSDTHLDSISFVDNNNIKAYMIIEGEPIILYNLVKSNNNWKIEK